MKTLPTLVLASLLATSLLVAGCGDDDPAGPSPTAAVSFADDVQPIFTLSCAPACHSGPTPNGGLDLTEGASHGELVGVESRGYPGVVRVVAGDAETSLLHLKLIGDPDVGNRMPLTGSLGADAIETVRRWIDAGARDD